MKNMNILLLTILLIFLSGCSMEYNIVINDNMQIEETIYILEDNDVISIYSPNINQYVNNMIQQQYDNKIISNEYSVEYISVNSKSGVIATRLYDKFSNFSDSTKLKDNIYKIVTMTINENMVYLNFDSIEDTYELFLDNELEEAFLDSLILKIKIPYEVISNNADEVNKETNTYIWNYDKFTIDKDVELVFDKDNKFNFNILDKVINMYNDNININWLIIIIGIVIISCLIFIFKFIIIISRRNNKI